MRRRKDQKPAGHDLFFRPYYAAAWLPEETREVRNCSHIQLGEIDHEAPISRLYVSQNLILEYLRGSCVKLSRWTEDHNVCRPVFADDDNKDPAYGNDKYML